MPGGSLVARLQSAEVEMKRSKKTLHNVSARKRYFRFLKGAVRARK
jgi:hypothetical protein